MARTCGVSTLATLTIRLSDEKHERLRRLAESRRISMNKLLDELSTIAIAEFDAGRVVSVIKTLIP